MNIVDASCMNCGKDVRWLPGNPRMCKDCYQALLQARAPLETTPAQERSEPKEVGA